MIFLIEIICQIIYNKFSILQGGAESMFKLMIADDNPYTLQELCQSTDWENFDFDLIGMYKNGSELLAAAKEICRIL